MIKFYSSKRPSVESMSTTFSYLGSPHELDSQVHAVDKKPSTSNKNRLIRKQIHLCFKLIPYSHGIWQHKWTSSDFLRQLSFYMFTYSCSNDKFGYFWIRWQHKWSSSDFLRQYTFLKFTGSCIPYKQQHWPGEFY